MLMRQNSLLSHDDDMKYDCICSDYSHNKESCDTVDEEKKFNAIVSSMCFTMSCTMILFISNDKTAMFSRDRCSTVVSPSEVRLLS